MVKVLPRFEYILTQLKCIGSLFEFLLDRKSTMETFGHQKQTKSFELGRLILTLH